MDIQVKYEGCVYSFFRGSDGEGRWVNITRRYAGSAGVPVSYTYVHLQLNSELTKFAVESGLGSYADFSRFQQAKKAEPVRRVISTRKKRRSRGVASGVKLFSLFDFVDTEEAPPKDVVFEEIAEASQ